MESPTYVPDGEACPKHGLPSRLLYSPTGGLFSQCQGCIHAFLDWFSGHIRDVRTAKVFPGYSKNLIAKPDHPQLDLGVMA